MLRASASRKPGDQLRGELHGVEVPPPPLIGVIGESAGTATFRARDARTEVREPNLDSSLFEPKVNRVNPPRVIDPEQTGIMRRECFHPGTLRHRSLRNGRPRTTKIPEEPDKGKAAESTQPAAKAIT
jgi:hypothetical protein